MAGGAIHGGPTIQARVWRTDNDCVTVSAPPAPKGRRASSCASPSTAPSRSRSRGSPSSGSSGTRPGARAPAGRRPRRRSGRQDRALADGRLLRRTGFPARRAELDAVFERELVGNLLRMKLLTPKGVVAYDRPRADRRANRGRPTSRRPSTGRPCRRSARSTTRAAPPSRTTPRRSSPTSPSTRATRAAGGRPRGLRGLRARGAEIHETVTPIGVALGFALILLYAALSDPAPGDAGARRRHKGLEDHASTLAQALAERDKAEVRVSQAERNHRSLVEQLPLVMYITGSTRPAPAST